MIFSHKLEKDYQSKVYNTLAFLLVFFSIIEINAPITTYGVQLAGLFLLTVLRFFLYWKLNFKRFVGVLLISIFILLMTYFQSAYLNYQGILWPNSIRIIFWVSIAILFYDYFMKIRLHTLSKILGVLIVLSSLTVILQIISYYILSNPIDFSVLLGGEGVRSSFDLGGVSYRPTGLTSEPAIHSGITFGLIVMKYLVDRRNNFSILLGLLSICLTLSTLGILLVIGYVVIIYTRKLPHIIFGAVFLFFLVLFLSEQLVFRYESFISGSDGSNSVKLMVLEEFFSNDWVRALGFGFVGMDGTAPYFYEALYDMTLFFNVFIYFGSIIGIVLLIYIISLLFFKCQFTFRYKLLITLALVKLSGPTIMFFSFFIMLLFVIHNKQKQLNVLLGK